MVNRVILFFIVLLVALVEILYPHHAVYNEASFLAAAAILGGAALIGGFLTNRSNEAAAESSNAAAIQMNRENNEFNRQERLETQEYNRKLWYEQQQYNSPINEAWRMRQAGMNPANNMSGASQSVAPSYSTPASAGGAPSMATPHYENPAAGLPSLLGLFAGSELQHEQAKGQAIQNETLRERNMLDMETRKGQLESLVADNKLKGVALKHAKKELEMLDYTIGIQKLKLDQENIASQYTQDYWDSLRTSWQDTHNESMLRQDSIQLQNNIVRLTGLSRARLENANLAQQIKESAARINKMSVDNQLTRAQVAHEYTKQSETIARTLGIKQNNANFAKVQPLIQESIELEARRAGKMNDIWTSDNWRAKMLQGLDFLNTHYGFGNLRGFGK